MVWKKVMSMFLALSLVSSMGTAVSADALSVNTPSSSLITIKTAYTDQCRSEISGSRTNLTCYSYVSGYCGKATKVNIVQTLQRKKSGKWENVKQSSTTVNSYLGSLSNSYSVSGGTYRVKSVCKVYSGKKYETTTKYSGEMSV